MKNWFGRAAICAIAMAAMPAYAADHRDAPGVIADPTTDINDVYAFKSGTNLVVVMTVNPLMGPVATEDFHFSTTANYVFHIDSNGDFTDDKTYIVQFADVGDQQFIRVRGTGHGEGTDDDIIGRINTAHDGVAGAPRIVTSGDAAVKVFAGPREDPFFFSLNGGGATGHKGFTTCDVDAATPEKCFLGKCDRDPANGFGGCLIGFTPYPTDAVDTFAGMNVSAIVIEVPLADFTGANLGVWASTEE